MKNADVDRLLASIQAIVDEWRHTNPQDKPNPDQIQRFCELLDRLYEVGWDEALGWKHELPEEYLPERYIQRRVELLDMLERELGRFAIQYRSSHEGTGQERQAISRYTEVMEEMFRIGHWHGEPDLDAQLPERHMPQIYKDYWEQALAEHTVAKK